MLKALATAVLILSAYAAATSWWILQEPGRMLEVERKARTANSQTQFETFDAGETARDEIQKAFFPIKQQLAEALPGSTCFGAVDARVQAALQQAAALANSASGLSAAIDTTGSSAADKRHGVVANERPDVGSGSP